MSLQSKSVSRCCAHDCPMLKMQLLNPRKRRNSEQLIFAPNTTSLLKDQSRAAMVSWTTFRQCPGTLRRICIYTTGLRELDQRNARVDLTPSTLSSLCCSTLSWSTEEPPTHHTLSTADFLRRCRRKSLDATRKFARFGI
jgi:hypothetical protein